jgi:ABC-type sugar transport system ATPase subunit
LAAGTALVCSGITKTFGGVKALKGVDFTVNSGRVHALLGENGAGKSTLIKTISGAYVPDAGSLTIAGQTHKKFSPAEARRLGIATIYQETSLFPSLSVLENLFTGQYLHKSWGGLDWKRMRGLGQQVLDRLGVELSLDAPVDTLDRSSAQIVEIARALVVEAAVLIMDEPTAALSSGEAVRLFRVVDALKAAGTAIIYVSHHLDEIFRLADEVTIMRDGEVVGHSDIASIDQAWVVERMIGRALQQGHGCPLRTPGKTLLAVNKLSRERAFEAVSFEVAAGEVLALAGLIGSGRHELMRSLLGLEPYASGEIRINDEAHVPRAGGHVRSGIGFVPQNRQKEGLVRQLSATVNLSLATLADLSSSGMIDFERMQDRAAEMFASLQVRPANPDLPASSFSGGNQQKLVLGRWLLARPRLLLIEEPTQGVDVGAKEEIHRVIDEAVAAGMAVLVASSDLPEIERIADRVLVMRKGRVIASLPRGTPPKVLLGAIAGENEEVGQEVGDALH